MTRNAPAERIPERTLPTEGQLAWCRERFGFEAMDIVPIDCSSAGVTGLAFVLPFTARPGYRTGDRSYAKGMLVADTDDLIVPRWAFCCRAVIDAGDLPLTASREGLQESGVLQFVRKQIGFRLLSELIIVRGQHPEVYEEIVRLHPDGLKALAVTESDVRDLLRSSLPLETTLGRRTIQRWSSWTSRCPTSATRTPARRSAVSRCTPACWWSTPAARTRPTCCA